MILAGGDLRMLYAAQILMGDFPTEVTGFCPEKLPKLRHMEPIRYLRTLPEAIDILVLPPLTIDGDGQIPAPYGTPQAISPEMLLRRVQTGGMVLGGNDKGLCRRICTQQGLPYIDYINSTTVAQANAVPTAEAALKLALEKTGRTIWGSRALVTGAGRIGTVLAHRLHALGASVTVAARQAHDRMRMRTLGMETLPIPLPETALSAYDLIFNTVPAEIFGSAQLQALSPDCLLIDLASGAGGVNREAAEKFDSFVVWAPGLPPVVVR